MKNNVNHPSFFAVRNPDSTYTTPKPTAKQLKLRQVRMRIELIQEKQELRKQLNEFYL